MNGMRLSENQKSKKGKILYGFVAGMLICLTVVQVVQVRYLSVLEQKYSESAYETFCLQVVKSRAAQISMAARMYNAELRFFTDDKAVLSGSIPRIRALLAESGNFATEYFMSFGFIDMDGNCYLSNGAVRSVQDYPYFKVLVNGKLGSYVTEPYLLAGEVITIVARAAYDASGKLIGWITGCANVRAFESIIDAIHIGENSRAVILAGNGAVVAHTNSSLVFNTNYIAPADDSAVSETLARAAQNMVALQSGLASFADDRGRVCLFYSPIDGTEWSFGIEIPFSQIYEQSDRIHQVMLFVCIGIGAVLFLFSALFLAKALKPLKAVEKAIAGIAHGEADLKYRIDINRNDEVGRLVDGFNAFMAKLHEIVSNVKHSETDLIQVENQLRECVENSASSMIEITGNIDSVAKQIANQSAVVDQTVSSVTRITENIDMLESMIQEQVSGVTEASAAVEQMVGNTSAVSSTVEKMAGKFNELESSVTDGLHYQQSVNDAIVLIAQQSSALMEVNTVIADIADQTNLLSMNAAIEAAHAGDAGKGFSVVADEIRKLSETSAAQSRTIGNELKKILASIESVVRASEKSKEVFTAVSSHIRQTDEVIRQISSAMEEQQIGSKQILDSLRIMNDSTANVDSASKTMAAENESILAEIEMLQNTAASITCSTEEMTAGAACINSASSTLSDVAAAVSDSIQSIKTEIDTFKI